MAKRAIEDFEQDVPAGDKIPGTPIEPTKESIKVLARYTNETAKKLAQQPKVRIRIPLPQGLTREEALKMEKPPYVPVCINGHVIQIRKGDWVEVPQSVADILEEANII